MDHEHLSKKHKLDVVSGVYIPVCLNILSILMFLRFGSILGQIGLLGMLGLLMIAYLVDFVTTLSLSAIASNGEVKGGGAYYLISRSLGPEFGGSIGVLFYLAQVLNVALNVVALLDTLRLNLGHVMPQGYWQNYLLQTVALIMCTSLCLAGSGMFAKASNALLVILTISVVSIPLSALFKTPFVDAARGIEFTGPRLATLESNLLPASSGLESFRERFGILFPATSGIFAGASMSGDLRNPSKSIPKGTLWALLTTFIAYVLVIFALAGTTTHDTLLHNANVIQNISVFAPVVFAGECAVTFFSVLMGVIGSAKLMQALARDRLFPIPGLSVFGRGTKKGDEPTMAILLTYVVAQIAMFANLNQIAMLISMGYQMTFFVMNLACFLLKIGSAPNFRPAFTFFSWQTALTGSLVSASAMFFIDETFATTAFSLFVMLFLLIHYLSPPKHWGDVTQNLIYHQVRKYLLRLKPEHIKFWRPQIILLINDPRRQTRLIQFCNSVKKGALYILGHVIVTDDFAAGVQEAKLQQAAWTKYISEYSRIKAFVQLSMSPTIEWGVRNLILSSGLGGMRPNIAVMGFYNMDELRKSQSKAIPERLLPMELSPTSKVHQEERLPRKVRRMDNPTRLLEGYLPTDAIRTEGMLSVTSYLTILEDLALRHRINVAVGKGFEALETPHEVHCSGKRYIDLWPVQMSAEISADGKSLLTTNFDTYTLILQLGYILHTVPAWKKTHSLRVLVFVEYEEEVEEARDRVKALLDKLRIEADVVVNWLASGHLTTYETIIHGRTVSQETHQLVHECLKDQEWWEDLQEHRNARQGEGPHVSFVPHTPIVETSAERQAVQRRPTITTLARLGVNLGINTHAIPVPDTMFGSDLGLDDGSSDSDASDAVDFNDADSVFSEADAASYQPAQMSLLQVGRRRSHGDRDRPLTSVNLKERKQKAMESNYPVSSRPSIQAASTRPGLARSQNSSSALFPPYRDVDGSERGSGTGRNQERTSVSRRSSVGHFSSRLVPETRITHEDGASKVSFAEPEYGTKTPLRSRRNSGSRRPEDVGDLVLNIPDLMDLQKLRELPRAESENENENENENDGESGSTGSSHGLSFNDLPSRAQHLILNELMRQNSKDAAVLFTTLPVPRENTCHSEEASIKYLSDIEVLCSQLPPVLLVLSNNMTVTVSL